MLERTCFINFSFFTRIRAFSRASAAVLEKRALLTIASWATPKSWWSVRPISRLFRKKPVGSRSFETHNFAAKIWGEPSRKDFRALEPSIPPLFDGIVRRARYTLSIYPTFGNIDPVGSFWSLECSRYARSSMRRREPREDGFPHFSFRPRTPRESLLDTDITSG